MAPTGKFDTDIDLIVQNAARFFAHEGNAKLVSLLADAEASAEHVERDNWDGGTDVYRVDLRVSQAVFLEVDPEKKAVEKAVADKILLFLNNYERTWLKGVEIHPKLLHVEDWRNKARDWVAGIGVTNQGRVRSNNIANRVCDGLLFRSQAEIYFYRALKERGITFAPLPVFLRGGANYSRIEPDFILVQDGICMCVEIDGDTVHRETPAEANARTRLLSNEGVVVERFLASECDTPERAKALAGKVHDLLLRHKRSR